MDTFIKNVFFVFWALLSDFGLKISKSANLRQKICMDIKVQWLWNVAYANPKMQYLGVIVLVYNN